VKILIAEDDAVSRLVLVSRLKKLGHEVHPAEHGKDAWYTYLRVRPRLVITDWMMPEMDGLELCRKIRAEHRHHYAYIIMLTALSGKERFLQGMNAGADDFVTKPIEPLELQARLTVAERILNLQTEIYQLEGLLPICMYCKRIRDDEDHWHELETYVGERSEMEFAETLCPECRAEETMQAQLRTGRG
jgi:sigma-B regulation protein RsbU (phosphoserine phosphatase)